jgi:hypothetical protein
VTPEFFDEVQQWYVVFTKRRVSRCHPVQRLLHPAFSHVYLMRERRDGGTLVIDPLKWGMAVQYVEMNFEEALLRAAQVSTAMLGYTADYRRSSNHFVLRGPFNCVTAVKAILGLRCWALTPRALYKRLLTSEFTTPVRIHDAKDTESLTCRHCGAGNMRA